jgi:hypothetical protein
MGNFAAASVVLGASPADYPVVMDNHGANRQFSGLRRRLCLPERLPHEEFVVQAFETHRHSPSSTGEGWHAALIHAAEQR